MIHVKGAFDGHHRRHAGHGERRGRGDDRRAHRGSVGGRARRSTSVASFTDLVQGLMDAGVSVVGSVLNEVPLKSAKKAK